MRFSIVSGVTKFILYLHTAEGFEPISSLPNTEPLGS